MKTTKYLLLIGAIAVALAAGSPSVLGQVQATGEPGSPSAMTTIDGKQLPPPDPKFGGVIPTPAIDRIVKAGLRYTQFHSTALCSPRRRADHGPQPPLGWLWCDLGMSSHKPDQTNETN